MLAHDGAEAISAAFGEISEYDVAPVHYNDIRYHAFAEFDFILTDLSMPEGDHILQAVMNLMLK